jgi:putative endopeptidase
MNRLRHVSVLALVVIVAACSRPSDSKSAKPEPAPAGGIDLKGMDRSVSPGDDFFAFANGAWAKTAEIPPDKSAFGTWSVMNDRTLERTRNLIEGLTKAGGAQSADGVRVATRGATTRRSRSCEARL